MKGIFESKVRPVAEDMLRRAKQTGKPAIIESFMAELNKRNWQEHEGEIVCLNKDGFPELDSHGWNMTIKDVVRTEFDKFFEIDDLPQNLNELVNKLKDPNITASDRVRYVNCWKEKHPNSEYLTASLEYGNTRTPKD